MIVVKQLMLVLPSLRIEGAGRPVNAIKLILCEKMT